MNNRILTNHYSWENTPPEVISIRKQVFIDEQNVPVELEYDEMDETAVHFSATDAATDNIIGCARIYKSSKLSDQGIIGRMAVLPNYRKKGIAFQLILSVIKYGVEQLKLNSFKLSAQLSAIPFYQKSGFLPIGETFIDAGIEHKDMVLYTPWILLEKMDSQQTIVDNPFLVGKDDTTWHFDNLTQCRQLCCAALVQAKNKIDIYSYDLEHDLFHDSTITSLLSAAARNNQAEVRLLVRDENLIVKKQHDLVSLSQRIPSRITIKICNKELPTQNTAFMLIDRYIVLYRRNYDSHEGFCNFKAPGRVRVLRDDFDAMWHRAHKSREFGTFGL